MNSALSLNDFTHNNDVYMFRTRGAYPVKKTVNAEKIIKSQKHGCVISRKAHHKANTKLFERYLIFQTDRY